MYIPIELYIENFLSFKELRYDFQQKKTVLIQGVNLTDDGAKSNGSGKSSLQEAIYFVYLGDTSRKINIKELVRRGEKNAKASLILKNTANGRGEFLSINREINLKGSSTLNIWMDGEELPFASVIEGNKLLRELIGISLDDFKNYFLVNRDNYKSFFKLSDNDKKEFIGRFSGADKIKAVYPFIESEIDELIRERTNVDFKLYNLSGKIDSLQKLIEDLEHSKTTQNEERTQKCLELERRKVDLINEKVSMIAECETLENFSFISDLKKIEKNRRIFENQLHRLEKVSFEENIAEIKKKLQEFEDEYKRIKKDISNFENERDWIEKAIMETKNLLHSAIECPKCKHKFSLQDENFNEGVTRTELEILNTEWNELGNTIKNCEGEKTICLQKINQLTDEISKFTKKENRKTQLMKQVNRDLREVEQSDIVIKKKIGASENKILTLRTRIKLMDDKRESIEKEIEQLQTFDPLQNIQSLIDAREVELDSLQDELSFVNKKMKQIEDKLVEKRKWLLDFKKFYSYLSNHSLKVIESRVNDFLVKMGTDLQVTIEGFKQLQSGEIRENITLNVLRGGTLEGNFLSFSAGERGRLECAMILTNQNIVNETAGSGKGLDFLAIDEILDCVDEYGMKMVIESLQSVSKTIWLISHIQVNEVLESEILRVVKQNNVSYIEQ